MTQPKLIDAAGELYIPAVVLVDASGNTYTAGTSPAPSTSIQTSVASSATDVTILASNALRKGAIVYNDSTAILYLLLSSGTSSNTNYSLQLVSQGSIVLSQGDYSGVVKGIWASANGSARVTEFS